jgi:hypothetical protein
MANREAIIQWVPGHQGDEGNEKADEAAKRAAARPARGQEGELSLACQNCGIQPIVTISRDWLYLLFK